MKFVWTRLKLYPYLINNNGDLACPSQQQSSPMSSQTANISKSKSSVFSFRNSFAVPWRCSRALMCSAETSNWVVRRASWSEEQPETEHQRSSQVPAWAAQTRDVWRSFAYLEKNKINPENCHFHMCWWTFWVHTEPESRAGRSVNR